MPKLMSVIGSKITRGKGTESDPYRVVLQFHSKNGKLLAEDDPQTEMQEPEPPYRNIEDSPVYKQGMVDGWFNCESAIFMKHTDKAHGNGGSYITAINGKGDVFVTINAAVKGGPAVSEGGRLTSYKHPKIAWDKFCEAFDEYMTDKAGPIDWRRMPTICRDEGAEGDGDEYTVTARLFARKLGKDEKTDAKQP